MMNTPANTTNSSLPFGRPQGGDQYVEAARRANGAAAADLQAQRARRFGRYQVDVAKLNQRVGQLQQVVTAQADGVGRTVSDLQAVVFDDHRLALDDSFSAIARVEARLDSEVIGRLDDLREIVAFLVVDYRDRTGIDLMAEITGKAI